MKKHAISATAFFPVLFLTSFLWADTGMDWLHVGTIVTTKWYTAKLFSQSVTFTQNDSGGWIGSDGRDYSMQINQSMDAGGLNQATVVAIDGSNAVIKTTKFMSMGTGDPERNSPDHNGEPRRIVSISKNPLGESPDLLAREATDTGSGKIVRHVQWPVMGHTVDAIRIDILTKNQWTSVVLDAHTGIGLHLAMVSSSGGDSGTLFMSSDILECRDLQVPWISEGVPDAVKNLKDLRLSGQIMGSSGFGMRAIPYSIDYAMSQCTEHWAAVNVVGSAILPGSGPGMSSRPELRYFGPGEFDGLWIGPVAAAKLMAGQVLDEDPFTNVRTVVTAADDRSVTISQSNRMTTSLKTYDRSTGLLLGSEWMDAFTKSDTTLRRDSMQ